MISNRAVKAVAKSLEEASRGSHEGGRGGVEAFLAWLEERRVHPQSRLYTALKDVIDAKTQAAAVSTCDARDLVLWYVNGLFVIGHGADGRMFFIHEYDLAKMPELSTGEAGEDA